MVVVVVVAAAAAAGLAGPAPLFQPQQQQQQSQLTSSWLKPHLNLFRLIHLLGTDINQHKQDFWTLIMQMYGAMRK